MIIVIPSKDYFELCIEHSLEILQKRIILVDRSDKHTAQNIGHTHKHKHTQTEKHTHTISFYIYIFITKQPKKTFSRLVDLANHSQFCVHAHKHTPHTKTNKQTHAHTISFYKS